MHFSGQVRSLSRYTPSQNGRLLAHDNVTFLAVREIDTFAQVHRNLLLRFLLFQGIDWFLNVFFLYDSSLLGQLLLSKPIAALSLACWHRFNLTVQRPGLSLNKTTLLCSGHQVILRWLLVLTRRVLLSSARAHTSGSGWSGPAMNRRRWRQIQQRHSEFGDFGLFRCLFNLYAVAHVDWSRSSGSFVGIWAWLRLPACFHLFDLNIDVLTTKNQLLFLSETRSVRLH